MDYVQGRCILCSRSGSVSRLVLIRVLVDREVRICAACLYRIRVFLSEFNGDFSRRGGAVDIRG